MQNEELEIFQGINGQLVICGHSGQHLNGGSKVAGPEMLGDFADTAVELVEGQIAAYTLQSMSLTEGGVGVAGIYGSAQ